MSRCARGGDSHAGSGPSASIRLERYLRDIEPALDDLTRAVELAFAAGPPYSPHLRRLQIRLHEARIYAWNLEAKIMRLQREGARP